MAIINNGGKRVTQKPKVMFDFVNSKSLDPRLKFNRSGTATYFDGSRVKTHENLLHTTDFGAIWGRSTRVTNTTETTDPAGGNTATKITVANLGAANYWDNGTTVYSDISSSYFTISCYFKWHGSTTYYPSFGIRPSFGNWGAVIFSPSGITPTKVSTGSGVSVLDTRLDSVGDGWYLCTGYFQVSTGLQSGTQIRVNMCDGTSFSSTSYMADFFDGDGSSGVYCYGFQVEARNGRGEYIPVSGAGLSEYDYKLSTAADGVPRFPVNIDNGESKGLLIETGTTNLFVKSQELSSNWSNNLYGNWYNAGVRSNTAVAPDGTFTADAMLIDSGYDNKMQRVTGLTGGATYTFSFWARKSKTKWNLAGEALYIKIAEGTDGTMYDYNIHNTRIDNTLSDTEWTRYTKTFTLTSGRNEAAIGISGPGGNQGQWAELYLWGMQLEVGDYASSYIPTDTSQVSRGGEQAYSLGNDFQSFWSGGDEGSFYVEWEQLRPNTSTDYYTLVIRRHSVTYDAIHVRTYGGSIALQAYNHGDSQGTLTNGFAAGEGNILRVSAGWGSGTLTSAIRGSISTDSSWIVGDATQMKIGASDNGQQGNQYIRKVSYWEKRLSDTELDGITEEA